MKSIRILVVLAMAAVLTVLRVGTASAAPSTTATPYPPSCPIMSVSTTTPNPGQTITVTGSNFHPSVDLTINLDTNVVLAHVLTSAGGSFSTDVTLPAGVTGNHVIRAVGADLGDCPVDPIQISIGAANSSPPGGLATTGVGILTGIAVALALIGGGLVFARSGRRRATHSRH